MKISDLKIGNRVRIVSNHGGNKSERVVRLTEKTPNGFKAFLGYMEFNITQAVLDDPKSDITKLPPTDAELEYAAYRNIISQLGSTLPVDPQKMGNGVLQWLEEDFDKVEILAFIRGNYSMPIATVHERRDGQWGINVTGTFSSPEPSRRLAKIEAGELLCRQGARQNTYRTMEALNKLSPTRRDSAIEWYLSAGGGVCFSSGEIVYIANTTVTGAVSTTVNRYAIYNSKRMDTATIEGEIIPYLAKMTPTNLLI